MKTFSTEKLFSFEYINSKVHKVEDEWHYKILSPLGFTPLNKEAVGLVRSYEYENPQGYKLIVNTGMSSDYWSDPHTMGGGFWRDLSSYANKVKDKSPKVVSKDIDFITKELISRGCFEQQEVPSGKMLNSFNKGKIKHNQEIRECIKDICSKNKLDSYICDKYWSLFW